MQWHGSYSVPAYEEVFGGRIKSDQFGVEDPARLDFFYLFERTRRWASGSLNSQPGFAVAPFLNPDFIRATFAYPGDKLSNPFHQHILATHAPDWLEIPYALGTEEKETTTGHNRDWRQPAGRYNYDNLRYWQTAGKPLLDEALAGAKAWSEVFVIKIGRASCRERV